MNTNEPQENGRNLEIIKWIVIFTLLIAAVVCNRVYYNVITTSLRVLIIMTFILVAGGISLSTKKGKRVISFSREVRSEIRKVIWPSYQETLHTTLIIVIVTVVMSLILWGLDGILVQIVAFITGLRF